jgi:hypothetical protein
MANDSVEITMRAKAFRGEGVREHHMLVDSDGRVWVKNPLDGTYTAEWHSLTPAAQRRARKLAGL